MKVLPAPLLILLFVRSATAQVPKATPTPRKDECSVAGMVVKLAGSEPLRRAEVTLQSTDDRTRSVSTTTDAGGRFELKRIEPGHYSLTVARRGFVSQEYGQKTPNDPGSALTLRPGQDVKDLLFRLLPSAVIAGRVLDEEGEPLPLTEVNALRQMYSNGKRQLWPQTSLSTNDLGEFRLFGLPPGRYFLRASYGRNERFNGTVAQLPTGSAPEQGYAPTYYPGSTDPAKAVALTIKAGEEISSVEILLRPVNVFSVRGRVYNTLSKRSSAGVMIQLEAHNTGVMWDSNGGGVNTEKPDGTFEIHDVVPGSYTVIAYWFDEGQRYQARQIIEVGNADVDGVNLTIAPGIPVYGHVKWDGPPSLERGELTVYLRGLESERSYGGFVRVTGEAFTLKEVLEGEYRALVSGISQDCFLKSVRFGGTESLLDGFTVKRGVEAELEVTISSRGARVQGTVTDEEGLPAAGVWVVAVPDETRRSQFRLYRARTTDQYGRFDLRGVAPGDYKLFSWNQAEQGAWEDPDFLLPFESKGEKISAQEGDAKSVDLVTIKTASTEQQKP
jgi:hypothetical protein